MVRLALKWIVVAGAIGLAASLVPGIHVKDESWLACLVGAAALALVNLFVRPILKLLSLPVIFLTLGLFLLVINTVCFWLASWISEHLFHQGFHVDDVVSACFGALLVSAVTLLISPLLKKEEKE